MSGVFCVLIQNQTRWWPSECNCRILRNSLFSCSGVRVSVDGAANVLWSSVPGVVLDGCHAHVRQETVCGESWHVSRFLGNHSIPARWPIMVGRPPSVSGESFHTRTGHSPTPISGSQIRMVGSNSALNAGRGVLRRPFRDPQIGWRVQILY